MKLHCAAPLGENQHLMGPGELWWRSRRRLKKQGQATGRENTDMPCVWAIYLCAAISVRKKRKRASRRRDIINISFDTVYSWLLFTQCSWLLFMQCWIKVFKHCVCMYCTHSGSLVFKLMKTAIVLICYTTDIDQNALVRIGQTYNQLDQ